MKQFRSPRYNMEGLQIQYTKCKEENGYILYEVKAAKFCPGDLYPTGYPFTLGFIRSYPRGASGRLHYKYKFLDSDEWYCDVAEMLRILAKQYNQGVDLKAS